LNLLGISINVVSLSGLIVGIGMMIDNSLIVIDNITQFRVRGCSFIESCSKGVYEIIKPLLSSLLTTCAVFIPLIYLSGVSGILFYDQAISIAISLTISYLTSIILLPTLYTNFNIQVDKGTSQKFNNKYVNSFNFFFKRKKIIMILIIILMTLGTYITLSMKKEKLPEVKYNDFDLTINWNETINIEENLSRTLKVSEELVKPNSNYVGEQNFLLPFKEYLDSEEVSLHVECNSHAESQKVKKKITLFLNNNYKNSIFTIGNSKNLFEQLFPQNEVNLLARIPINYQNKIYTLTNEINKKFSNTNINIEQKIKYLKLEIDINKLALYKVDINTLLNKLKSILGNNKISALKTTNEYLPIIIKNNGNQLSNLNSLHILNQESVKIPIKNLISLKDYKNRENFYAKANNNYIPVIINTNNEEEIISFMKSKISEDIEFEGKYFENKNFIRELFIVLLISVLLLYFILAAQFESILQPIIILSEVPLTLGISVIVLKLLGISLNIMSMIGLIIILGIIINDSILKVDAINKSRYLSGMSIMEAIHNASKKRLNAILMTSLTTIFAMVPIFFTSGIGYDLQKPLAVVVITSMIIGTIVSIYYVPIVYWFLTKKLSNGL